MALRRLPRTYILFVLVTVFGPLLTMVIQGDTFQPRPAALLILGLMLWGLGRGSLVVWALFLLWNLFLMAAIGLSAGGQMLLSGWLLLALSVTSLALLLAPSTRAHVGLRRRRRPSAQPLT